MDPVTLDSCHLDSYHQQQHKYGRHHEIQNHCMPHPVNEYINNHECEKKTQTDSKDTTLLRYPNKQGLKTGTQIDVYNELKKLKK